jgi:hypothetical protein
VTSTSTPDVATSPGEALQAERAKDNPAPPETFTATD